MRVSPAASRDTESHFSAMAGTRFPVVLALCCPLLVVGCGTTRMTDTQRTATEQLLISNAVDQAVSQVDFRCLAGKRVYFDPQYLDGSVDRGYLVSSLRQHLLASGCVLQEERTSATYVVEARSGGIGTDRHSLLVGIPQMNVPTILPGQPSQIPEIPFAKKTDQNGVAKIAVFAYNRVTGLPVWQSGVVEAQSTTKDLWVLGTGPFQNGTIQHGTKFAGEPIPLVGERTDEEDKPLPLVVPVTDAAAWPERSLGQSDAKRLSELLGATTAADPLLTSVLMRVHLDARLRAVLAGEMDASHPDAKSAAPAPPPTPNAGGVAETQPLKVLSSGFGFKPDG